MALIRSRGNIVFECDGCGDEIDTGEKQFDAALEAFKLDPEGQNWLSINTTGDWEHFCVKNGCREEQESI